MGKDRGVYRRIVAALKGARERACQLMGASRYRPEEHYMRGPGPKTREKTQHQAGAR
jgi:hypothetical protein